MKNFVVMLLGVFLLVGGVTAARQVALTWR